MIKEDIQAIKAIDELSRLLTEAGIEHVIDRYTGPGAFFNQIRINMTEDFFYSAICHYGSYGYGSGRIEVYNFFEEPIGCLTPEEACKIMCDWVSKWKKKGPRQYECNEHENN